MRSSSPARRVEPRLVAEDCCQWCDREGGCDCQERMACEGTGIGHVFCGTRPCGCPNFLCCEHTDPAAEQQRIAASTRQEDTAIADFLALPEDEKP